MRSLPRKINYTPLAKRFYGGSLQVPQVELVHSNGHAVTLYGVMHIAEQSFWDNTKDVLKFFSDKGGVILLEGVRPGEEEEVKLLSKRQIAGVQNLVRMINLSKSLSDILELPYQDKTFILPEGRDFVNNDISLPALIKKHKFLVKGLAFMLNPLSNVLSEASSDPEKRKKVRNSLLESMKSPTALEGDSVFSEIAMFALVGIKKSAIIQDRNLVAVESILASSPQPAINVWGAGHTPGLVDELQGHGYHVIGETWNSVISEETFNK